MTDTSVKYFTSNMAGAPVLNGTAGSLIGVLDACLVTGFGLKTVDSLVVAGGVATMNISTGHSHTVDSVALVAGAAPAGLNGEQKVTAVTATTVSFATAGISDQTATGTITTKVAPAGWLKPFSGTNLAAYKSAAVDSTGMYLRLDDTGTLSARVIGYESMSGINTGTGPFPTTAQVSGGGYWCKSLAANATAQGWTIVADGKFFMINMMPSYGSSALYQQGATRGFGDVIPLRPAGDSYGCVLNSSFSSAASSQFDAALDYYSTAYTAFARAYTGLGGSSVHSVRPYTGDLNVASGMDATLGNFPSVIDGTLRLSKRYCYSTSPQNMPRSDVPGLYSVPQNFVYDTFKCWDKISGTGPLAGRNLLAVVPTSTSFGNNTTSSSMGISFIDITGPWR